MDCISSSKVYCLPTVDRILSNPENSGLLSRKPVLGRELKDGKLIDILEERLRVESSFEVLPSNYIIRHRYIYPRRGL